MTSDYFGRVAIANLPFLLDGLWLTIGISILSGVLALVGGTVIGVLRVTPVVPFRVLAAAYVEFFRNCPPLIYIFFIFFALPMVGVSLSPFLSGVLALAVYTTTYVAEAVRSGLCSVNKQQFLAARSLGFTYLEAMRYVILPQAFVVALPPLVNSFISIVKGTALVSVIGVPDLMYKAQELESRTFRTIEVFTFAAILYLMILLPMTRMVQLLETRLSRFRG